MEEQQNETYLSVWLNGQLYCLAAQYVVQIMAVPEIVPVPEFPPYAYGVANIRNEIVPVLSTRKLLGMPHGEFDGRTCVIFASVQGRQVGFVVDSVYEVCTIDNSQMLPVPAVGGVQYRFVDGMCKQKDTILLRLAVDSMLSPDELAQLDLK
ncbi:chemotaxis protein CheW [Eubacteriales bacterium OttesenSCG-928-K08]|nr:chemotaxis protein CheW [Eubacteriales bacterium OttesenSCG-928-K08]